MKSRILSILIIIFVVSACGGSKKALKETAPAPVVMEEPVVIPEPPEIEPVIIEEPPEPIPVKEIAEKLIPALETPPPPDKYFVIIGSFRVYNNAIKYQEQIKKDGFSSVLLKNDAGLYRVSVMATNEINQARTEIRRIRKGFPKYNDTWLLIQLL